MFWFDLFWFVGLHLLLRVVGLRWLRGCAACLAGLDVALLGGCACLLGLYTFWTGCVLAV